MAVRRLGYDFFCLRVCPPPPKKNLKFKLCHFDFPSQNWPFTRHTIALLIQSLAKKIYTYKIYYKGCINRRH